MSTRCAIYVRYSSDQQRPESIADQVRHCRQEVARHTDWLVLDDQIYSDEAITGASVEGRHGLQRLVQAAFQKPRPFDLILVDDTSRLSRDVVDTVQQFRELRFHGIDLFFVNQGLHSGRDNAEFLLAIYGAMDSEYIRELGRKTHRGLESGPAGVQRRCHRLRVSTGPPVRLGGRRSRRPASAYWCPLGHRPRRGRDHP